MVLSKLVFGMGFEPMNMAKNIILSSWFFGGELSFANNVSLALSRWVSFLNGIITPRITNEFGITEAFIFGAFLCLISAFTTQLILVI
jgi:Mg/Co/Ni transporter MgtE